MNSIGVRMHGFIRTAGVGVGIVLVGLVAARMVWLAPTAHAQGGPPPQGQGPFGGPDQRMGGFMANGPFVVGTVAEVGQTQKMIAVTMPFGRNERIVKVTDKTKMVTQRDAKVSELKVGDQVQVSGVPTGIRASSVTIGDAPGFFSAMMPGRRPGMANAGGQPQQNPWQMSFASASGKVTSVSPLTVALDNQVSLTIKMAPDARVQKIAPVALSAIKEGDRIMAVGKTDSQGILSATSIGINMGMGGGMFGGFGGGPGRTRGPGRTTPQGGGQPRR